MKTKKVLIECHSLLGDLVLMTPMIKQLKAMRPDFIIDMVIATKNEKEILLLMGDIVNEYYFFQPSKMKKLEILELFIRLRKKQYDYGFVSVSENAIMGALFLKAAGCKWQIGETSKNRFLNYNHSVLNNHVIHRAERNIYLLTEIGITGKASTITLKIPEETAFWAEEMIKHTKGKKVVSICMGTGDFIWKSNGKKVTYNCKQWGYRKFIELTKMLVSHYAVVWIGGKKEADEIGDYLKTDNFKSDSLINMIGKTNIKETLSLLNLSTLVVGADTGMMHCAAALGKKTLCIIGATDPKKICPFTKEGEVIYLNLPCGPCYGTEKAVFCENRLCLSNISTKMVSERINEILLTEFE